MKFKRLIPCAILLLLIILLVPSSQAGDIYKWTDEKGALHITDRPSNIPEKYRAGTGLEKIKTSKTDPAQDKKIQCKRKFEVTKKLMIDVRYNYAEWHIDPAVWVGFNYENKEDIIAGLSRCREVVAGSGRIIIKDGYSGEILGKMGVAGPKIYK